MFIEISNNLKKLSKFFPENLYVVGGYVRNKLLGLACADVDLTSSVNVEEVVKRLASSQFSVKVKNLKLGSILICCGKENFEYTAFRKEVYDEGGSHYPAKIEPTDKLEEDAKRRDFTINAIYYNINKDECVDLCHGIVDLTSKILRAQNPEEVLSNDGERILRMVRIAGELDFKIDKATLRSAKKNVKNVMAISGNRKLMEMEKILYCDKRYNKNISSVKRALKLLNNLKIWTCFGLKKERLHFSMALKSEDRFLGFLIDLVDNERPECLQVFLENILKNQFSMPSNQVKKICSCLAGFYCALDGMQNKKYFFKFVEDWAVIYPLLGAYSKHIQNKYNFFYKYNMEHSLPLKFADLDLTTADVSENFPEIDERNFNRIFSNLLSKVFDGKVENKKEKLLQEIKTNLRNY